MFNSKEDNASTPLPISNKLNFSINKQAFTRALLFLMLLLTLSYQQYQINTLSNMLAEQDEAIQQTIRATIAISDLLTNIF